MAESELSGFMVQVPCIHCGLLWDVPCTDEQYKEWLGGKLIQKAMPDVSREARELLISGTCPACWSKIVGPDPDN